MKKFFFISLILSLILFTALIKNSTKRIDDEIFILKENIRLKKTDFENVKLENVYLSSAEKLMNFQDLYFEDELIKKEIKDIKILRLKIDKFLIEDLKF